MPALALKHPPGEDGALCLAADPFSLAQANINPLTGLSTDYLNHFHEPIMLLEMLPSMPECRSDLAAWQPSSYHEHFAASRLSQWELAVAAYDVADASIRRQFDALCEAMNVAILRAQQTIGRWPSGRPGVMFAQYSAARLKSLVTRANAVIHGTDDEYDLPSMLDPQTAVDVILVP